MKWDAERKLLQEALLHVRLAQEQLQSCATMFALTNLSMREALKDITNSLTEVLRSPAVTDPMSNTIEKE